MLLLMQLTQPFYAEKILADIFSIKLKYYQFIGFENF